MRKFLVVNMNYMGDALLTTPAIAALRQAFPDAQIDTVVGAGTAAEVLHGNPDLNQIIARTARGGASRLLQIYRLLRAGRYTDAVILPPLPGYAFAAWLARTPRRVGLGGRGMNHFLTHLRQTKAVHMADAMLDTMPLSPGAKRLRRLVVAVDTESEEAAARLLAEYGIDPGTPLTAVNIGATRPQKRWFAESFAEMLDSLGDSQIVLVGAGAEDTQMAVDILSRTKSSPINLVGKTKVRALAAVLKRCDLLISGDSGPMHLATAVGTPCVALFGSTDPKVTGPFDEYSEAIYKNLSCSPCGNHPTCNGRYDCLREITPEEVVLAARRVLRSCRGGLTELPRVEPHPGTPFRPSLSEGEGGRGTRPGEVHPGEASPIRRILIATKFRFIGDTLLATPIFRAVRAQWPDAHIALLTGKNARVLLQNNPYLDEIWEFDPYKSDKGARAYLQLVKRLRGGKFDLCLALNRSFHSALTPWLGGIKTRAGFESEGRGPLLNCRVDYDREKSEIACYFDVLRAVAPDAPVNPALELWMSADETSRAQEHLLKAWGEQVPRECLVGIQPGASQVRKQWSAAGFAQIADRLTQENPSLRLALIGGPDEKDATDEMLSLCGPAAKARAVSFAGACDLRSSLALVSQLGLFVGNDTAIMHSAVALGVPTVALFGPTNPRKWGNYGPCHQVLESPDGTMASIAAEDVLAAASALLTRSAVAPVA